MVAPAQSQQQRPLQPAVSEHFQVGQVWRYRTRPEEPESRITVGAIERPPVLGLIVHVKLSGIRLKGSGEGQGHLTDAGHIPITEAALSASITELTSEAPELDGFQEGYRQWREAFLNGKAGVFTLSVAEIVDVMDRTLGQER